MSKPNIVIPSGFGGIKTDFDNEHITNGFPQLTPDVLAGDNLNKFIDDTYKGLNGVLELFNGCVLYDSTVTYTNTSLVFNITNNNIKLYHSLQNGNVGHALTDNNYWEEVSLGGGNEVGDVVFRFFPTKEAGKHLLDGTLLNYGSYSAFIDYMADLITDYPDLFTTEALWQQSVATYGVCGKFVYDSVNNTVRLPKITGIIEGTTDLTALGDLVQAGLPNITGKFWVGRSANTSEGAFVKDQTGGEYSNSGNASDGGHYSFDASRSSLIYGNSSTVQPQTIKGLFYIVIATSTKTDIEVDIDEIATDLNGKADVDLTNCNDTGNIKMAHNAMPSSTVASIVVGASGTTYTAPADGYFSVIYDAIGTGGSWALLYRTDTGIGLYYPSITFAASGLREFVPVRKGDTVGFYYNAITNIDLKFIYAVGSESEAN